MADYNTLNEKYDKLLEEVPKLLMLCTQGMMVHKMANSSLPFMNCDEKDRDEEIRKFIHNTDDEKIIKAISAMAITLEGDKYCLLEIGDFFSNMFD